MLEILWLLMRALRRSGLSMEDVSRQLIALEKRMSRSSTPKARHSTAEPDDWVQIMTLWSMDPVYVDEDGRPVPLRLRGPAPSIEALLQRVGSALTVEEVCTQLISTGAAKRVRGCLHAIAHAPIVFPRGSAEQSAHHLDLLHWVLLNIEHNAAAPDGALWVERQSICHNFPQAALSAYSSATQDRVQAFLAKEDANMHRIASFTPSNGHTVRATVQVLFSARSAEGAMSAAGGSQTVDRIPAEPARSQRRSRAQAKVRP